MDAGFVHKNNQESGSISVFRARPRPATPWSLLLLLLLFAQAMGHVRQTSLTFDEGPHLAIGYATLRTGDLRLQPVHIHPPLANVMAALPLLTFDDLPDPRTIDGWEIASLSAVTDAVVWQYPQPQRLALAGRLPIVLMTMLLGAVVYRWASDLFGSRGGLLALALYAFDPNIIAHGSLITTDMAVTLWGTLALFLAVRTAQRPRWALVAGGGAALGLALASKVSAVSLLLPLVLLWLVGPRALPLRQRLTMTAAALAIAATVLWAVYGFEVGPLPGFPLPIPAVTHLRIYLSLQEHYRLGHPAFLLGQNRNHGWWYYFPIAFILKTPLPTLLLALAGVWGFKCQVTSHKSQAEGYSSRTCDLRLATCSLLPFPLLYTISSLFSTVDIGYRHLLPVLPFLFIGASRSPSPAPRLLSPAPHPPSSVPRPLSAIYRPLLLLWLALGTLRIFPDYLSFFNELAGGAAGGYRYLVDSNLDWGQNLWQLRDWMAENNVQRVYYAHYSPANPQMYGIAADFLPPDPRAVPFAPWRPAAGTYAIGATVLQGSYTPDVNTYAWFRSRQPTARLGNALFIYQVEERPAPTWTTVCAAPLPLLELQTARANLGQPEVRVLLFDCQQSWVYADGTGLAALPAGADAPPGAALELAARHADGTPFYALYTVDRADLPYQALDDVSVEGPLALLGFRLEESAFQAGSIAELWTVWQVVETPARPLSLMAHLAGADGVPVAVGDGLGFPVEQWQAGDVIVQRHRLAVPEGEAELSVLVGAYWLDTMERWPIRHGDGAPGDHLNLARVQVRASP